MLHKGASIVIRCDVEDWALNWNGFSKRGSSRLSCKFAQDVIRITSRKLSACEAYLHLKMPRQ